MGVLAFTVIALSACGQAHERGGPMEVAHLWNREFSATAVEGDTEPPFAEVAAIRLTLAARGRRAIEWGASCNSYLATLRITPERLMVAGGRRTSIRCEPSLEREDTWLTRFLESDPNWSLDGGALTLTGSEGRVLTLRQSARLGSGREATRKKVRLIALRWLGKMARGDISSACRLMDAGNHAPHPEYPRWGPAKNCEERWLHSDNTPLNWKPSPTAVTIWGDSDPEVVAVEVKGDRATVSVEGIGVRRPVWLRRERGRWLVGGAEYPI